MSLDGEPCRSLYWRSWLRGANFLLDVIPYRHSDEAQILGGRSQALCQAWALTSENDLGKLYRPGSALPDAASLQQRPAPRAASKKRARSEPISD